MTPEAAFPEKIVLSCVTKDKGPLTKIMRINPSTGELVKDGSECSMAYGFINRITVSSPQGFARMLRTRTTNQAIVHGISEHYEARIVTKNQVNKQAQNGTPVIARSKKYLSYSDGPGIGLFDHDKPRSLSIGSDAALKSYTPDALLEQLAKVHPAIANAAHVTTPARHPAFTAQRANYCAVKVQGAMFICS